MMSLTVSIRVPTWPLERVKLRTSDTISRDRSIREASGGSDREPPTVHYAQLEIILNQFASVYGASLMASPLAFFSLFQNAL